MGNVTKTGPKQGKIPRMIELFLKNIAMWMTQVDAYEQAGYKGKTRQSMARAASRLSTHLQNTMTARDTLNLMVPDKDLFSLVNEKLLTAPEDIQVRAASLIGKWKGLEQPETGGLQGSTIIFMQQLKDDDNETIDITPGNDSDIPIVTRKKLTD